MSNGHRGGRRMAKHWHAISRANFALTATGTSAGNSLALTGPWTVLRMLADYIINFTAGSTIVADDQAVISLGIGVVSSDAFAAGAGSLPDPGGEPEYPWLYWAQFNLNAIEATPEQVTNDVGAIRRSIDIHSMRKLKPRESLVWVVEYGDIQGAPPVHIMLGTTRVLVAT